MEDDDRQLPNGDLNRTHLARLLREAAGVSAANWVMSGEQARTEVHERGTRALVEAAGWTMAAWEELGARSAARSDVLLAGARALGIRTSWRGWT